MTGFATAAADSGGYRVRVTLKSVNHRFLDVAIKAPSLVAAAEPRLRAIVQERLTRGRVETSVWVDALEGQGREVALDVALLQRVANEIDSARAQGLVAGELTVTDLLRLPDVLAIRPRQSDPGDGVPSDLASLLERVVREAVDGLAAMRATEGEFLARDLDARLATLSAYTSELETLGRDGQLALSGRLRERLASLGSDQLADPALVAQEVVRFVARSDIDEEIVRLRGHLGHWLQLAAGSEPCGRKLDFLVQEMNREINTIGAKVEGSRATEVVIAAKVELERVREQVQNVE
jgi:uncharacterized protein (TIGR00255 family)